MMPLHYVRSRAFFCRKCRNAVYQYLYACPLYERVRERTAGDSSHVAIGFGFGIGRCLRNVATIIASRTH